MRYLLNNLILLLCLGIISPDFAQQKHPVKGRQSVVDLKKEIEELKANQQQSLKEIQELKQLIQTLLNNLAASTAPPPQPVITLNVYGESFKGSNEARVAIIEYSDFECDCRRRQSGNGNHRSRQPDSFGSARSGLCECNHVRL